MGRMKSWLWITFHSSTACRDLSPIHGPSCHCHRLLMALGSYYSTKFGWKTDFELLEDPTNYMSIVTAYCHHFIALDFVSTGYSFVDMFPSFCGFRFFLIAFFHDQTQKATTCLLYSDSGGENRQ